MISLFFSFLNMMFVLRSVLAESMLPITADLFKRCLSQCLKLDPAEEYYSELVLIGSGAQKFSYPGMAFLVCIICELSKLPCVHLSSALLQHHSKDTGCKVSHLVTPGISPGGDTRASSSGTTRTVLSRRHWATPVASLGVLWPQ